MVVIQDDNDILQPAMTASDHIADRKEKGALFFYNSKPISGDEALTYVKTVKELYISTKQMDTKQPKVYLTSTHMPLKD